MAAVSFTSTTGKSTLVVGARLRQELQQEIRKLIRAREIAVSITKKAEIDHRITSLRDILGGR